MPQSTESLNFVPVNQRYLKVLDQFFKMVSTWTSFLIGEVTSTAKDLYYNEADCLRSSSHNFHFCPFLRIEIDSSNVKHPSKKPLASSPVLVHCDLSLSIYIQLAPNASSYGIGAVLTHVMRYSLEAPYW